MVFGLGCLLQHPDISVVAIPLAVAAAVLFTVVAPVLSDPNLGAVLIVVGLIAFVTVPSVGFGRGHALVLFIVPLRAVAVVPAGFLLGLSLPLSAGGLWGTRSPPAL